MKKLSTEKLYKIFVYVALISLAISIIVPVAWVFVSSLKTNEEFQGSPWTLPMSFYFQNFIDAFEKARMAEYFLNSVIVTALGLFLLVIIALPASYVLARFDFKGKKIINTLFMAGLFINVNYIVVPIFLMLLDWDDVFYSIFGQSFFLDNIVVLAIVYASTALPFTIYLLSGYFKTLPKAYEEAAYIDGCGYFKTLVKVMAPMAKPSIITVILFNFLAFWNEYIIALTLMPGASKTLPVGLVTLSKGQMAAANYGQLYAGLVIVMLPTLILYIMVQKKLTQGMTLGGLKD
ncbi:carbohydrate ABC transporter permease [Allocoprobacillus halotolerans]|uniref:Carbohydrate ABC transporter permease n=1 Tax=Allocoprobacillus halotolerans TaxID=2944914 RepID=A0ABY5I1N2_9FIRM|nr:carbohydrate ABC transporter permease [Allocoprobacillus halotolerans]UTY38960.1 carbohydrate ABC transporter permease [Allocoprobacillus halotolerans]